METSDQRFACQVGSALRRVRLSRRLRVHHLATVAGIDRWQLARYERGLEQPPVPVVASLLIALNCSADEFGAYLGPWGLLSGRR